MTRPDEVARLIEALCGAVKAGTAHGSDGGAMCERASGALAVPALYAADEGVRPELAVCSLLDEVLEGCRGLAPAVSELARALEDMAPHLAWHRRPGAELQGVNFFDGHANTMVVGPRGLERRSDVWIGASLLAPNVRYPEHSHPPEEIYVALTDGEWYREGSGWFEPGIGGVVHNPSGVRHAMRSRSKQLLAVWCLWTGPPAASAEA